MNKFKSYVAGGVARIKNAPRPKAFLLWATAASFGLSLVFTLVPAGAQSKRYVGSRLSPLQIPAHFRAERPEILFRRRCSRLPGPPSPRFKAQSMRSALHWEIRTTVTRRGHSLPGDARLIGMEAEPMTLQLHP